LTSDRLAGNTGDKTVSPPLTFKLATASAKLAAAVPNGYVDATKALNVPAGDSVTARECNSKTY